MRAGSGSEGAGWRWPQDCVIVLCCDRAPCRVPVSIHRFKYRGQVNSDDCQTLFERPAPHVVVPCFAERAQNARGASVFPSKFTFETLIAAP